MKLIRWQVLLLLISLLAGKVFADFKPLPGFQLVGVDEQTLTATNNLGVTTHINAPSPESLARNTNITLIFFALPNGNTIEQTVGKKMKEGDDWHFE